MDNLSIVSYDNNKIISPTIEKNGFRQHTELKKIQPELNFLQKKIPLKQKLNLTNENIINPSIFLEKSDGGGSRFNEMVQYWAKWGNEITVLSGMVHYSTGKKPERYSGKYFYFDKNFYKNVDVIRCNVSSSYNKKFFW